MNDGGTSEGRIEREVGRLLNLADGEQAIPDIVHLGEPAIPALERVLRGPSQALHHSRCWAADALAAIDGPLAITSLERALHDCAHRTPPALSREAEDVVVSCIADHLTTAAESHVVDALLGALETRPYPGCVRALGRIGNTRAIPLLVRALFEDATREGAAAALRRMGRACVPAVIAALRDIHRVNGAEPPTYVDGRADAAAVLGTLLSQCPCLSVQDRSQALQTLRKALTDSQRIVRMASALALIRCQHRVQIAIRVLVRALDEPDWYRLAPVMRVLLQLGSRIEPALFDTLTSPAHTERAARRRRHAIWIAGQLGTPAAVRVLSSICAPHDTSLRLALINALDRSGPTQPSALERYLEDSELAVRRQALLALYRRHAVSIPYAVQLLGDPDRQIRRLASACLAERRVDAQPALGRVVLSLGLPLHGLKRRLRLSWHATLWLLSKHDREPPLPLH